MEVEAPADGFLTDVRAEAGQNVPVGQVIAIINDTADAPAPSAPPVADEPEVAEMAPEGQSVIMPALGMAQDTGLIVAWHKSPGDAVVVDDVLFEVETDKATMEVAAGHDGFIAALLAEAGQEVPVGEVVAVISKAKPEAPISRAAGSAAAAKPAPKELGPSPAPDAPKPENIPPKSADAQPNGRILASPKARRLALEQGLDLTRLAAMGHPPPYHVSDLETLRALPAAVAQAPAATQRRRITAKAPASGFAAFLSWGQAENNVQRPVAHLWPFSPQAHCASPATRPDDPGAHRNAHADAPDR